MIHTSAWNIWMCMNEYVNCTSPGLFLFWLLGAARIVITELLNNFSGLFSRPMSPFFWLSNLRTLGAEKCESLEQNKNCLSLSASRFTSLRRHEKNVSSHASSPPFFGSIIYVLWELWTLEANICLSFSASWFMRFESQTFVYLGSQKDSFFYPLFSLFLPFFFSPFPLSTSCLLAPWFFWLGARLQKYTQFPALAAECRSY